MLHRSVIVLVSVAALALPFVSLVPALAGDQSIRTPGGPGANDQGDGGSGINTCDAAVEVVVAC